MEHGQAARRRAGRPSAGQDTLSRARILEAALRLVDKHGLEALSMRRLATELGVNPMSLYHYLPGKAAVLSGLIDMVYSELQLPSSPGLSWQTRVRDWALAYLELARSHPHLVLQIVSDAASTSDAMLKISEPLYQALDQAGLSARSIAAAADAVVDWVHGSALALSAPADHDQRAMERELLARIEAQPPGSSPTMCRVFRSLVEGAGSGGAGGAEDGLSVVLKGIEAIAAEERSANTRE